MGGISGLYDVCNELLVAASEACALAPGGPMERVFVSAGPPAWDCPEQLTVHAGQATEADTAPLQPPLQPFERIGQHRLLNLVALTVTALRCAPVLALEGQTAVLPSDAELDATAAITLGDAWAIWNHVATRYRAGSLFAPSVAGFKRELIFDPAVPVTSEGGTAGWQLQFRVQLDGFSL